jgi:hypothetical protein
MAGFAQRSRLIAEQPLCHIERIADAPQDDTRAKSSRDAHVMSARLGDAISRRERRTLRRIAEMAIA